MKIGMVGLGRMGMNMARRLLQGGHQVVNHLALTAGGHSQLHRVMNDDDGENQGKGSLARMPAEPHDDKDQQTGKARGLQAGQTAPLGDQGQIKVAFRDGIDHQLE